MRKHKRKMLKVYASKVIKIPKWATKIEVTYKVSSPNFIMKIGDSNGIETKGYLNETLPN